MCIYTWYAVIVLYDCRYPTRERHQTLRKILYELEEESDSEEIHVVESSSDNESDVDEIKSVSAPSLPSSGHKRKSQSAELGIITLLCCL